MDEDKLESPPIKESQLPGSTAMQIVHADEVIDYEAVLLQCILVEDGRFCCRSLLKAAGLSDSVAVM